MKTLKELSLKDVMYAYEGGEIKELPVVRLDIENERVSIQCIDKNGYRLSCYGKHDEPNAKIMGYCGIDMMISTSKTELKKCRIELCMNYINEHNSVIDKLRKEIEILENQTDENT